MTKQELAHIARLMYDLQEYCRQAELKLCETKGTDEERGFTGAFACEAPLS